MRHEITEHFERQKWYCQEFITNHRNGGPGKCGQVFLRQHYFKAHLRNSHGVVASDEVKETMAKSQIGRNGQVRFWCGFCRKLIDLKFQGQEARSEKFGHLFGHVDEGQDVETHWQPLPPVQTAFIFPNARFGSRGLERL